MIDIKAIILEVADEWDSIEYQDMDTPAAHAVALATEVAKRAVLAEREACAVLCERNDTDTPCTPREAGHGDILSAAIRKRSNAESNGRASDPTRTPG